MKNSSLVKQNIWLVLFIAIWVVAGLEGKAESTDTMISLNPSGQQLERILVTKSSDVNLTNDSVSTLYDFTFLLGNEWCP